MTIRPWSVLPSQLARLIARQSRTPSGPVGQVYGRILDLDHRRINARAVAALDVADRDVLDVGFGGGVGLRRALRAGARTVTGVDVSAPMVAQARRRLRSDVAAGRVRIEQAGVEALPYPDGSFDRVLTVHTIYFWTDPSAGLRELRRVLRPGGRLLVATAAKDVMARMPFTAYGFRLFEEAELESLLTDAGLSEVVVERDGSWVISHASRLADSRGEPRS